MEVRSCSAAAADHPAVGLLSGRLRARRCRSRSQSTEAQQPTALSSAHRSFDCLSNADVSDSWVLNPGMFTETWTLNLEPFT